jgi:hypothetical protein
MPNLHQQFWTAEDGRHGVKVDEQSYKDFDGNEAYLVYGYAGYLTGTVYKKWGLWCATLGDGDVYYYITRDEAVYRLTDLGDL